jgi:hypothetical protein
MQLGLPHVENVDALKCQRKLLVSTRRADESGRLTLLGERATDCAANEILTVSIDHHCHSRRQHLQFLWPYWI